jgi:hypothetical protein
MPIGSGRIAEVQRAADRNLNLKAGDTILAMTEPNCRKTNLVTFNGKIGDMVLLDVTSNLADPKHGERLRRDVALPH